MINQSFQLTWSSVADARSRRNRGRLPGSYGGRRNARYGLLLSLSARTAIRVRTLIYHSPTGSQGKVEESMTQLTKAEALKTEKLEKERELQQLIETAGASGHQKLRVCDICGAYLSVLDSDRRLADHFGGKVRPVSLSVLRSEQAKRNSAADPMCLLHSVDAFGLPPTPSTDRRVARPRPAADRTFARRRAQPGKRHGGPERQSRLERRRSADQFPPDPAREAAPSSRTVARPRP